METTRDKEKQYLFFKDNNLYRCLDESSLHNYQNIDRNISALKHSQEQQNRNEFLNRTANWAIDQHKLPDSFNDKNRVLLKEYAETDRRTKKTNDALLRVGIKRSGAFRLKKTEDVLLRVGLQRSLSFAIKPCTPFSSACQYFYASCFSLFQYVGVLLVPSLVIFYLLFCHSIVVQLCRFANFALSSRPIFVSSDSLTISTITSTDSAITLLQTTSSSPLLAPSPPQFHRPINHPKQHTDHIDLKDYVSVSEQRIIQKCLKRSVDDRGVIKPNIKRIFFRSTHGHIRPILVDLNGTVTSLFEHIEQLDGIPSGLFRIKCNGVDLYHGHNRTLLSDYHLKEDMDIHAVFRGRGGSDANTDSDSDDEGNSCTYSRLFFSVFYPIEKR
jgi:hypothetical protein